MKVLDLFSGVGGFSLGLERAGMETAAFCEINAYCRAVLRKHWPATRIYENVEHVTAEQLQRDGIAFDAICGGFPCQDISVAGAGAGLDGERSNLWWEYHRLIEESRPDWAIIENVSVLRSRGLDVVLGALAAIGYDAEWYCIPASAVGAPHQRDRLWIVAYPNGAERRPVGSPCGRVAGQHSVPPGQEATGGLGLRSEDVAYPKRAGLEGRPRLKGYLTGQLAAIERGRALLANAEEHGREPRRPSNAEEHGREPRRPSNAEEKPRGRQLDGGGQLPEFVEPGAVSRGHNWLVEPDVGRVAHGVPKRVDRLRALGNAVIPQIPEMIGRAILAYERAHVIP